MFALTNELHINTVKKQFCKKNNQQNKIVDEEKFASFGLHNWFASSKNKGCVFSGQPRNPIFSGDFVLSSANEFSSDDDVKTLDVNRN